MNILNSKFNTPYSTAPFSDIKDEDFLPAFKIAIENARAEIDAITSNSDTPTFKNTIEALDYSGEELDRISSIFFNLNSAETNDAIQKIAQDVSPLLSEFSNDITLNEALFKRVKAVYDSKSTLDLTIEQTTLLDKKYKGFSRNGANLNDDKKEQLRAIDKESSQLKLKFGEHILAETNAFEMHLTDKSDLSGLPEGAKEAAKQLAESKGKDGWLVTLDYPSYIPFMTYADNRELRKKLSKAFGSKGFNNNDLDNQDIVLRIANLRFQRAKLLGYKTHAHFVLEERMAETPEKVNSFLNELLEKAKPAAKEEFKNLENFAKELDGIDQLQKWDSAYYSEKLKQKLFSLDDEQLKPYFKLENVIDGAFTVAEKLFGLQFEEIDTIDKYHDDVLTYKVTDATGELVSIFYADFFPRAGKRNGAWMTSYKPQMIKGGHNHRPHVSIVCNFTKPTKSKPSLLTFNEVTTLFHEFGHALHGMLANTTYPSLSGTNVFWDFVELPSQILENWCYEEDTLKLFATHYKTDEVIPMELIEKIKASSTFHEGMQTMRQLSFGLLDMAWHGVDTSNIKNVKTYETKAFGDTSLYPDVIENCMSTSFAHIFQGGYSSGYYSYKWAEVLDADAFEYFKDQGIFNKTVADKFKAFVLSQGGTQNPMTLYKKFRGQEPKPEALLRRAGLIK
ncbi:M3 family metallopeptidase [Winogradskyella immobilis]|uniref:M3 family metallopeptidase n=1 Tax=Winogradskyella immobilis TaxID=2816852 RepID=A0ABS8EPB7_9FLAO|nr:M3 family metallopeptidase [Winogradskyella immobilis]MCC1484736.1 M3 family metallopeptidase [Winogradskyella immobilis]MCG0016828.1 M3 family metallopeptidase [Winogradskyella immobilis]